MVVGAHLKGFATTDIIWTLAGNDRGKAFTYA
jgi:hypothetical protein